MQIVVKMKVIMLSTARRLRRCVASGSNPRASANGRPFGTRSIEHCPLLRPRDAFSLSPGHTA